MRPRACTRPVLRVLFGLLLVGCGSLLTSHWPVIYDHLLAKLLQLNPGSQNYEMWETPPVPIYMNFYFFNWSNPEDFFEEGSKPHFTEVGPYSFRETRNKKDVTWNDNLTLSYKHERTWYFDEKNSVGPSSDLVTTLNALSVSAAYVARDLNYFLLLPLNQVLRTQPISITKSVAELLFEGYSDTLLLMGQMGAALNIVDSGAKFDKFAWFYMRNASKDFEGVFNIGTGEDDISKVSQLNTWNYMNHTRYFPGGCGDIQGSWGERFAPRQTKTEPLRIYTRELCRVVEFDFSEEREVEGVSGYRYTAGPRMVDNGTLDPDNECFCGGQCVPSGTLNVSTCGYGSPSFVSYPHFYLADPYYLQQVDGLSPDPDKHEFHVTIEPTTGLPLDVAGRLQMNLLVQPYTSLSSFRNFPKIFFPMFWFEEKVQITPELALYLKLLLYLSPVGLAVSLLLAASGILIVIVALANYYLMHRKLYSPYGRPAGSQVLGQFPPSNIRIISSTSVDASQNQDECSKLQPT